MENNITANKVRSAFGGESQAYQRYKVWGRKAEDEGYPNVARLFYGIAYAEEVHAGNHFEVLGDVKGDFLVASMAGFGLGDTKENLEGAKEGEDFEIHEMYPAYLRVAEMQNEKGAIRSFKWALEAEKAHSELFQRAIDSVSNGNDIDIDEVSVCGKCGYTTTEGVPDYCPICGAPRNRFKSY
ncbi:rubrerythrin family protein [Natranaerobius thermophilus]|uniref:Rubrerythrin n=1 Tax=Natranaerobius thermophilus (strain ATCC BAA-1301 / DSM 18059 / JW/NM-WN-LF) TaxID=457570 RepID=B2A0Q4_NATTJ|nr:rubrerythrin family protein [Natranaerobius thermophilus]ACB85934.1 Rubrerythrin [Natranaerobius thermophilus JW/NM-WN-LF]